MSESTQARASRREPETEISVDLAESDNTKAVTRRAKAGSDIAEGVRDNDEGAAARPKSPAEREIFKRMTRFQRNITKQFDQKLAESEARHQQELSALKQRYEGVAPERGGSEGDGAHDKAMKAFEDRLAAANERGDSAEAAKITAEMIRADGAYHAKLAGTAQRADTGGATAAPTVRQQQQTQGPTPAGSRFIQANEEWWHDPDFQIEKDAASRFYLELCNEKGYDNNSDETFREVARRMKAKFKDLHVVVGRAEDDEGDGDGEGGDEPESRRRAPAANIQDRGNAQGQRPRSNRRTLSPSEIKTMRAVGMNPDNDKDVVQFLREAVAMEQSA